MIWHSIQSVIVIFLLIGAGIFVAWRKWVSPQVTDSFPKLLVNLAIPGMVVYQFYTGLSRGQLFDAWLPLLILAAFYPVSYLIGRFFAYIFNIQKTRRGVFTVLFSFSNSVFIGFPVAQALFGDAGMPYAMYYYLANTTFFWSLGYYAIRRDADHISGRTSRISPGEVLKKLVTPPIITIIVMFAWVMLEWPLPDFLVTTAKYISQLTTPLSLVFMGCVIYQTGFDEIKLEKDVGMMFIGRFLLIPAVCFALCQLGIQVFSNGATPALLLMRNVFTVQSGLPVMTQTVILAQLYAADVRFATKSFIWTTLLSIVTIPACMVLFQYI